MHQTYMYSLAHTQLFMTPTNTLTQHMQGGGNTCTYTIHETHTHARGAGLSL